MTIDLLQMAKRVGPQYEVAEHKDLSGEEGFSLDDILLTIEGAIESFADGTVDLSMKAPMSVSKPVDLG